FYGRARALSCCLRSERRRWTGAAGYRRIAPQRCPGVQASGRAVGTAACQLAGQDTLLALARRRLARRGATACRAVGPRLRRACTTPTARALHGIIGRDDHGQSLTPLAAHAGARALCPTRPGAAPGSAARARRAQGEFPRRA